MISKTIGFRGTLFSDTPMCRFLEQFLRPSFLQKFLHWVRLCLCTFLSFVQSFSPTVFEAVKRIASINEAPSETEEKWGKRWETMGNDGKRWETMGNDGKRWETMGNDGKRLLSNLHLLFYVVFICFSCVSFKLKIRAASRCVKLYPDFGSDLPGDGPAQDEQSTHLELWAETFLRSRVASELLMPLASQGVCATW